ncbi:MAG: PAS domain-containing protein, partial [Stutzerimonas stutzeri]
MNAEHCAPAATWNEAERLIALARYTALDALCITDLEALAAMAADLCACPAAAIHFVDDQYQHCMAAFALEREAVVRERSPSAWAIRQEGALVLPHTDTLAQFELPRLADGQTTGFYAAVILRSSDGLPLGTLSVFDHQPRELTPRQGTQLLAVARQVMALLELSRLRGEQERSRQIIDSAQDYAILATDLQGRITSWNSGARRLLGWSSEEAIGRDVACIFSEADRTAQVPQAEMRTALEQGRAGDERWHLRKDGSR